MENDRRITDGTLIGMFAAIPGDFTMTAERVCDSSGYEVAEPSAVSVLTRLIPPDWELDTEVARRLLREAADAGMLFPRETWRLKDEGWLPVHWDGPCRLGSRQRARPGRPSSPGVEGR